MTGEKYRYLFPYERVKPGANILIYGAGIVGMEYLKQIMITQYCNIVGMVDSNAKDYTSLIVPVYAPQEVHTLRFDSVVIALRTGTHVNEIKRNLCEQGVAEEDIICILERNEEMLLFAREDADDAFSDPLAIQQTKLSIAILVSGGFGDMIIDKRFVVELTRLVPECMIDIYYTKLGDFLKYLYSDCVNINAIIPDLGTKYLTKCSEYALGMEVVSTRYVHVDVFKKEIFMEKYNSFSERIERLREESQREKFDFKTLVYSIYQRRLYSKYDAYTAFNYNGAFEIIDKSVSIPLDTDAETYFQSFELGKYVTINYGNGTCKDGSKASKMWSKEYLEEVVFKFKKRYTKIKVVQLGDGETQKINNVDRYLFDENFRVVAHILKNTIFHLDIEGGLVHIASQLGTKCIVLFGPTSIRYFGYKNNINISVGTCCDCYGLYEDPSKCARGMKEPECMYSITPELVLKKICDFMQDMGYDK